MKVTCSNCGAEVDVQGSVANCPYCGSRLSVSNMEDGIDNYFDNVAPTQPQPSNVYANAVNKNDKKLKKAVKDIFSWAVLLLVIGVLRLFTGLLGLEDIEAIESELPSLVGTIYYAPLSSYLSFATAETIMHIFINICSIVLVVFASRLKKTDIYSKELESINLKVFIISCIMAAILLAYLIVEICIVSKTIDLIKIEFINEDGLSTMFSSLVWTIILVVGGALCVAGSVKLSKQAKQN